MTRNIGWDLLGLLHPRFPVARAAHFFPPAAPLGFQDYRFGTKLDHLKVMLDTGKVTLVRAHFIWDEHKNLPLSRTESKIISAGAYGISAVVRPYGIPFYFSAFLEHNRVESVVKAADDIILNEAPDAHLANCPMRGWSGSYHDSIRETHGPSGGGQGNSLDGVSIFDIGEDTRNHWRANTAHCVYTFAWHWEDNGRKSNSDHTPPALRRNFPTDADFRKVLRLTKR